jgi:hypothetical protein
MFGKTKPPKVEKLQHLMKSLRPQLNWKLMPDLFSQLQLKENLENFSILLLKMERMMIKLVLGKDLLSMLKMMEPRFLKTT